MAQDDATLRAIATAKKKPAKEQQTRAKLTVPLGRLWLRPVGEPKDARGNRVELRCFLGETEPKVIGGRYGGWTIVSRPRKKGITEWVGTEPLLIEVSFRIDRWDIANVENSGLITEKEIRQLERMAGLDEDGADEPPLLRWNANGPHDFDESEDTLWYIEDLTWGVALRNNTGNRVRQDGVIQLREYVDDDFVQTGADKNKIKAAARKKKKAAEDRKVRLRQKNHVVQPGEDLYEIATKYRGKRSDWKILVKLNPGKLRDPRKVKDGIRIKLRD